MSSAFSLVFVCTGNRFRSPLAEHLLRAAVHDLPVQVASVGTQELSSGPALAEALEVGRELGVDLGSHRSRTLSREHLADADLVLGFERRHVRGAVVDGGVPRERAFTVGELNALLRAAEAPARGGPTHGDTAERARAAVAAADRLRHRLGREPEGMELADPFGGSDATYRDSGAAVQELVRVLARGLFDV